MKKIVLGVLVMIMTLASYLVEAQYRGGYHGGGGVPRGGGYYHSYTNTLSGRLSYGYNYGGYNYLHTGVGINFNYGGYGYSVPYANLYTGYTYSVPVYYPQRAVSYRTLRWSKHWVQVPITYCLENPDGTYVYDANGNTDCYTNWEWREEWVFE